MMEPNQYSRRVVLPDGSPLLIRAIRPDDKQRLLDGFHRLTGRSVYFRFLNTKKKLTDSELEYFTEIDFVHHVALVATLSDEEGEKIIGVGRYVELNRDAPERVADIAFAVDDEHHNEGIGTLLFERIIELAQHNGIARIEADVLLDNTGMVGIFQRSGFRIKTVASDGVAHITFSIAAREPGNDPVG